MRRRAGVARRWIPALLGLLTLPAPAQIETADGPPERLRIERERVEEVFESPDLASLRAALQNSPRFGGHGQTHANFELVQQLNADRSGCRLTNHQVRLRIVVYLPRWHPPRGLGEDEQGNWPQALAALEAHEAGHAEHAAQAAHRLDAGLAALYAEPRADCQSLQREIERVRVRTLMQLELRNSLYDEVTDFGRLDVAPPKPARARPTQRGPRQRRDDSNSPESSGVRMRRS